MKRYTVVLGLCLLANSFVWAGSKPAIPSPQPNLTTPENPEERRAQAIAALKQWISEDRATIANPGSGKAREIKERVATAKRNLQINEQALAGLEAGQDMTVYFCSLCGREQMKSGTCPHCKKPLVSYYDAGAKRPHYVDVKD